MRAANRVATSEEEHAVSTIALGPTRPKTKDGRPSRKLRPFPVPTYAFLGMFSVTKRC